jgi:hypothetical protein
VRWAPGRAVTAFWSCCCSVSLIRHSYSPTWSRMLRPPLPKLWGMPTYSAWSFQVFPAKRPKYCWSAWLTSRPEKSYQYSPFLPWKRKYGATAP